MLALVWKVPGRINVGAEGATSEGPNVKIGRFEKKHKFATAYRHNRYKCMYISDKQAINRPTHLLKLQVQRRNNQTLGTEPIFLCCYIS